MEDFNLNLILFPLAMVLVAIVLFLGIYLVIKLMQGKGKVIRALNMSLFLVSVPKISADNKGKKSFKELVAVMEQFYASLSNLKDKGLKAFWYGQPVFVFEMAVPHIGEEICFYVACPRRLSSIMEKQIHGFFPGAEVRQVEDYNIFNPQGVSFASCLALTRGRSLPIKTYQNLETDPLNEIVNALSKLGTEGEGAAIQLIIRPTKEKNWRKASLKIAREMQRGKSYSQANLKTDRNWFFRLTDIASGTGGPLAKPGNYNQNQPSQTATPLDTEIIKALETKASKVVYEANINLVASAADHASAQQCLLQLESVFAQFNSANLNNFKAVRPSPGRALKKIFYAFSFRIFEPGHSLILSTEELSSIYHFPTTEVETPKVKFIRAKQAAPPPGMPSQGLIL
ncbi:hypothetical protein KJ853_03550, partial [Patescibacteria group bacterium]|nr:hypothetical protein [Patescibacteria group bacterium]